MRKEKYRYLPHTADIAFIAYGESFQEAIENAAEALLNVMLDIKKIKKSKLSVKRLVIKENAESVENLVWFTLQDILSKIDTSALNAFKFSVVKLNETGKKQSIEGELYYSTAKDDYSLLEVKAVTPHGLGVVKQEGMYSISVVIDV